MPWNIQSSVEYETKFSIPPRFHLPADLGEAIPLCKFTSTYFDTDHHRLGQLGLTLRKRVERSQSVWQLKIPTGAARLELEVDSGHRSIPREFQDLLMAFFRKQEPVQLGKIRTRRRGIQIKKDNQVVAEVVHDSIALLRENRIVTSFQELEVEVQEGTKASQLKAIRKILIHAGAQEKPLQAKIFQALQLPYPLTLEASDPSVSPAEYIRERLHSQFLQMIGHDPGTRLGRDSEDLHQMRVATRKTRAILRAVRPFFAPEWIQHVRQEIGWIGSLLGEVRDWDVLLEYFQEQAQNFTAKEQRTFQSILHHFDDQRSMTRARLLEGLRSDRYLDLLNHVEDALRHLPFQPSPLTLMDITISTFHQLREFVKTFNSVYPKSELHRMRILLKRTRYAVELTEPLFGKYAKRFLQQAKHLQDLLGQHQDSVVAEDRLLALKHHSRGTNRAYVIGLMVERLRNRQDQAYQQIPEQWEQLEKQGKKL